jgi:hypothetical protein
VALGHQIKEKGGPGGAMAAREIDGMVDRQGAGVDNWPTDAVGCGETCEELDVIIDDRGSDRACRKVSLLTRI